MTISLPNPQESSTSVSDKTSPSLRPATPSDAPAVSSLIGRVWSKHFAYSVSPSDLEHFLETALSPQQISEDISNPFMQWMVMATPSSEVVGIVQLVLGTTEPCLTLPDPIELRRLYVDDAWHGTGLAKTLVQGAEDLARYQGYRSMWLGAWEDNKRGIRFYEKMGFKSVGEHTFLVGESVRRDWVMEKIL